MTVDWDIRWGLRVQLLGILAFIGLVITNLAWGWPGWWTLLIPVVVTIVFLRLVGQMVIGQMTRERREEDRAYAQLAIKPAWTFTDRDTYGQWWDGQRWRYGARWA